MCNCTVQCNKEFEISVGEMNGLGLIIVLIIHAAFLCTSMETTQGIRNKRALVYPPGVAKVQAILGAGFPVDLQDETVIVGIVIKSIHVLPQNSSFYRNPNVIFARKRRSLRTSSRWDIYKAVEQYSEMQGYGGKGCLLRTICDLAHTPIDKTAGIVEEILHTIFTPTSTNEEIDYHEDNEYYAAQKIGTKIGTNCDKYFPDCKSSFVDIFTVPMK